MVIYYPSRHFNAYGMLPTSTSLHGLPRQPGQRVGARKSGRQRAYFGHSRSNDQTSHGGEAIGCCETPGGKHIRVFASKFVVLPHYGIILPNGHKVAYPVS